MKVFVCVYADEAVNIQYFWFNFREKTVCQEMVLQVVLVSRYVLLVVNVYHV